MRHRRTPASRYFWPADPLALVPRHTKGENSRRPCVATLSPLPECAYILQHILHLEETPEIAIPDHALPVDQKCPGGMIHHPLARRFTVSPNACHTAWTACGGPVTNAQEARSTPRWLA